MIWHDMIYDMVWYMIWYDMTWYMIWYDMIYMIWYDVAWYIIYDMVWYDMTWYVMYMVWYDMTIYLTVIGFKPSGSSTVHIYTQAIHRQHNRHKQYIEQHSSLIRKSADRAPPLRGIPWHLPYNCGKSTENPQSG